MTSFPPVQDEKEVQRGHGGRGCQTLKDTLPTGATQLFKPPCYATTKGDACLQMSGFQNCSLTLTDLTLPTDLKGAGVASKPYSLYVNFS